MREGAYGEPIFIVPTGTPPTQIVSSVSGLWAYFFYDFCVTRYCDAPLPNLVPMRRSCQSRPPEQSHARQGKHYLAQLLHGSKLLAAPCVVEGGRKPVNTEACVAVGFAARRCSTNARAREPPRRCS